MKLCRFNDDRLGVVRGGMVHDVTAALDVLPTMRWPLPHGDAFIAHLDAVRERADALVDEAKTHPLESVRLLSPVANPSKIIGAPVNYAAHKDEIDENIAHGHAIKPISEWGLFLKSNTSLVGASQGVERRFPDQRNDHEVELAVVIGRQGDRIPYADAMSYIAGYAIGLDMTLRGPQFQSFRKSIDTYSVLGPWLVTADELTDPSDLELRIGVNGDLRQQSRTRMLICDVPRLIEYASSFYTLYPGDIIMTGTPDGVGPVVGGDMMEATIEGVGTMRVAVRDA
ncbi:fumarylacetoacetate hydrolase family protein [Novosphingobium pentaromativorans]|nr:fumarylacetoacetate hydrolase family protein [Novosphingobium pentaromativorans]AIT82175.1 2-hydroxyhepta-2,4-diene-1,7-dioate isomerase [Novosphingobium pentaromativorans US6-1]